MRSLPSSNVVPLSFSVIGEGKWVLSYILATMVTNLTHADSYFERMNKSMGDKSKIMDLLPESGRILDVGCGSGDFMRILEDHGYDVRGIDASEESVKRSGRKSILGYADELSQHFEDSYFDAVICSSVFHEVFSYGNRDGRIGKVSSLSSTLLSIHRVLKRGGKLVVRDGVCPRTSSDKSKNEHVTMNAPADEVRRFLSNSPFAQPRDSSVDRHVELHQIDDNTFSGSKSSIMEFMFTYTWGRGSFAREVQEFYGIFTLEEYAEFVESHGFKSETMEEYIQDGYVQHLRGKVSIDCEFPSTNAVWSYVSS